MSTYTPLASITLTTAQSSVVFSDLPQSYDDLIISVVSRNTSGTNSDVMFRFNNDSGSNYSFTRMFAAEGASATGTSDRQSNISYISGSWAPGTNASSTNFAISYAQLNSYSNTTTFKTLITSMDTVSSVNKVAGKTIGLWRSTNPITSITILSASNNLDAGSTFNIYGISSSLETTSKAAGGDSVYSDGTYWYHVFKSSGTFTPSQSLTADYLVVGGGGGGGNGRAGGGGGGGFRTSIGGSALSLTAQAYTVTIGAGGAAATQGSNSIFSSITSTGGGYGGGLNSTYAAGNGGSGGGGAGDTVSGTSGGTGTAGQGSNGGKGKWDNANPRAGGGGGGAGAVGSDGFSGSASTGGAGGNGSSSSLSGFSVTYAGGGGGAVGGGVSSPGLGGSGGGGAGSKDDNAVAISGTANTGGGGGGGGGIAGLGGSGIIIVRYSV